MYFLLPLVTVAIWAGNAIVNIMSADIIAPEAISFYRWFIALLTLTPFLAKPVWSKRQLIRPFLAKLALLALLGMVLNQSLAYFAAATTTATHMTLIFALVPLLSLFLSIPILGQRLSSRSLFGAAVSLTGLIYMLSQGQMSNLIQQGISPGDKYILIAVCSYSLYGVLLKRWKLPFNNWIALYVQMLFAVIMLCPLLAFSGQVSISNEAIPLVLYAAIPTSILATWLWMQSIQYIGADKTAMFMNLMPIFTAIMASIILNENLESYQLIGGVMVLSGVTVTQIKRRELPNKSAMLQP